MSSSDCGLWYLAEYEGPAVSGEPGGRFKVSRKPRQLGRVRDYLRRQKRFSALSDDDIAAVEAARDAKWPPIQAPAHRSPPYCTADCTQPRRNAR